MRINTIYNLKTKISKSRNFKMFKLSEKKYIPLIDVEVQSYVHQKLLTRHIHLKSDSDEKCFIVAFKTLPTDSTGVAHILEHTVLCGSKNILSEILFL